MTTTSFPVGELNFTTAQWRKANGASDGIADCDGTSATDLRLSLSPTTDVATVGTGTIRFQNFALQVTAAHGLTLAPAVGTPKTYVIGVMHDPALETDPLGPLRLAAPPKTALGIPSGGAFLPLFEVTRAPSQVLSQASVVDQRSYAGDLLVGTANTAAAISAPLGSRLWTGTEDLVRVHNSARTGAVWQSLTDPPWVDLTSFGSGWKERALYQCRARVVNGWVEVQGAVQATTAFPAYAAVYLPAEMHPTAPRLMGAHQASDRGPSYELVAETSGQVQIYRPDWVSPTTAYPVGMTFPISGRFPIATPTS